MTQQRAERAAHVGGRVFSGCPPPLLHLLLSGQYRLSGLWELAPFAIFFLKLFFGTFLLPIRFKKIFIIWYWDEKRRRICNRPRSALLKKYRPAPTRLSSGRVDLPVSPTRPAGGLAGRGGSTSRRPPCRPGSCRPAASEKKRLQKKRLLSDDCPPFSVSIFAVYYRPNIK